MKKIGASGNFFLRDELARNSAVMFAATTIAGLFATFYMLMAVFRAPGTSTARIWRIT